MSHVRLHALALRGWGLGTESICVCGKVVGVGGGVVLANFGMYCKRDSLQIFSLSNTK